MKQADIPTMSYGDLGSRLVENKRMPNNGMIEVTHRCNFRCAHCYVPHEPEGSVLSKQELCDIIDVIAEEGCMWVTFTGGEPFVRRDFMDVYIHAKKRGLIVSVFTNGSLITPQIADQFLEFPPISVSITVYGATRETYEAVTGAARFYDHTMKAIELLLERGISLEIKTMVITLNKHELWEMKRFAQEIGVKFRYDFFINAMIDGSTEPCKLRLPPSEVVKLMMSDEKQLLDLEKFCQGHIGVPIHPEKLYGCGAGSCNFAIDPYGQLLLCLMIRRPSYNLRVGLLRERFREGFYDFFPHLRSQKRKKIDYKCARCELINLCNQCAGHAMVEYGDPEAIVEYACQMAHLQMRQLRKLGLVQTQS